MSLLTKLEAMVQKKESTDEEVEVLFWTISREEPEEALAAFKLLENYRPDNARVVRNLMLIIVEALKDKS